MALAIRPLPVLENAAADRFVKKANRMLKANRKLDLSKKAKTTLSILKTAKIEPNELSFDQLQVDESTRKAGPSGPVCFFLWRQGS